MRTRVVLFLPLVALCACATPWGFSRRADLQDIGGIGVSGLTFGAAANFGPVTVGALALTGPDGIGQRGHLGLGGTSDMQAGSGILGIGVPIFGSEVRRERRAGETRSSPPRCAYRERFPSWGSVGIHAGLLFGLGAHLDVVELFDFLLGLASVDLVGDDYDEVPEAEGREEDEIGENLTPIDPTPSPSPSGGP